MFIQDHELQLLKKILTEIIPEFEVWAFGSRVHGINLKPFSDLDLIIIDQNPIDIKILGKLKQAFSESDLPFPVDIIAWSGTEQKFKSIIKNQYIIM